MAQAFTCDRCRLPMEAPAAGAAVLGPTDPIPVRPRTVIVPAGLPGGAPVDRDVEVEFSMGVRQDLCAPCLVAALVALVMGPLRVTLSTPVLATLTAAIEAHTLELAKLQPAAPVVEAGGADAAV